MFLKYFTSQAGNQIANFMDEIRLDLGRLMPDGFHSEDGMLKQKQMGCGNRLQMLQDGMMMAWDVFLIIKQ